MKEYCVCGHTVIGHVDRYPETTTACVWCECMKFKLDNLSYVEDLAKERNLI
jgi:hypothetical protein